VLECAEGFSSSNLYAGEIIGDHQRGFRRNISITDHILCIRQILEKKWEYNEALHRLQESYDSVRREALYNILIEFGIPKKLVRLIKILLISNFRRVLNHVYVLLGVSTAYRAFEDVPDRGFRNVGKT
jgi:hypothetical protein